MGALLDERSQVHEKRQQPRRLGNPEWARPRVDSLQVGGVWISADYDTKHDRIKLDQPSVCNIPAPSPKADVSIIDSFFFRLLTFTDEAPILLIELLINLPRSFITSRPKII